MREQNRNKFRYPAACCRELPGPRITKLPLYPVFERGVALDQNNSLIQSKKIHHGSSGLGPLAWNEYGSGSYEITGVFLRY